MNLRLFNAPLRGAPWNFVSALGLKKARMRLPRREKVWWYL